MSILAQLEAELETLWGDVSGQARAAIEAALADAKSEVSELEAKAADVEAKIKTVVTQGEASILSAAEAAAPEVKAAVQAAVTAVIADIEHAFA